MHIHLFPSDFELTLGTEVELPSHNYPGYYPDDAYVLWTFQPASSGDNTDIVFIYHVEFGYVQIGYYDYLKVGYGWNPVNTSAILASYGNYYFGYPADLYIPATDIFVEFDADDYNERTGFELKLGVFSLSGNVICKHLIMIEYVCKYRHVLVRISQNKLLSSMASGK